MDIYIHPGINKGGIHRKHISFLWVRREGHNDQSISFAITPPPKKKAVVPSAGAGESGDKNKAITR